MTANNTTRQKMSDGFINSAKFVGACVVAVVCFALGVIALGAKKVSEGAEYAAEQGQT
jgi:hypothetical protein